jgi:TonB family protein
MLMKNLLLSLLLILSASVLCSAQDTDKTDRVVESGVLNSFAITNPRPVYPDEARAARIYGAVTVRVVVNEEGVVIDARAVSGPDVFRSSAIESARKASFTPQTYAGKSVKFTGTITYNYQLNEDFTLSSGKHLGEVMIGIAGVGPNHIALALGYKTRLNINDIRKLRAEVEDIWQTFKYEVERNNFNCAEIWTRPSSRKSIRRSNLRRFVFNKSADGSWITSLAKEP